MRRSAASLFQQALACRGATAEATAGFFAAGAPTHTMRRTGWSMSRVVFGDEVQVGTPSERVGRLLDALRSRKCNTVQVDLSQLAQRVQGQGLTTELFWEVWLGSGSHASLCHRLHRATPFKRRWLAALLRGNSSWWLPL